ncbi:hypothetical protein CORC01_10449 [Colletotrichum orchidophilum]|uniref:Uncharacterized protein n=1 Tax=Colletotrichum orchidophilum TaxID=1209926 RepID=A0A1G4AYP7_9PEZI|nr:uncharacterized protein CORC01_10449 [Colletotrichum orchidophilum]OHE94289.1 hypothetical protein CORC01_10449 [Colletotrichum orchidophilum]
MLNSWKAVRPWDSWVRSALGMGARSRLWSGTRCEWPAKSDGIGRRGRRGQRLVVSVGASVGLRAAIDGNQRRGGSGKNVRSYDCRQKAMDRRGGRRGVSREAGRKDPEGKQARGSKSYDAGLVLRRLIFPQGCDLTCWGVQVEGGKKRGAGVKWFPE